VDADTILIGDSTDTITITSDTLSLTDNNWSITAGGTGDFVALTIAGADINTGGTLNNVAYLDQSNAFTVANQNITATE